MSKYVSPRIDIKKLVLIEEQNSPIKCGKCGENMHFQVYYKKNETYDFLACKACKIYLQRLVLDQD